MSNELPVLPTHRYTVEAELPAGIEDSYNAASAEEAMAFWVPGLKKVEYNHDNADEPYGAGSFREVTVIGGQVILENIIYTDRPHCLVYTVPSFGSVGDTLVKNYHGKMEFTAIDENRTQLKWSGYFEGAGLKFVTEPFMKLALRNLIAIFARRTKKYLAESA